jgi:hypothetical protein
MPAGEAVARAPALRRCSPVGAFDLEKVVVKASYHSIHDNSPVAVAAIGAGCEGAFATVALRRAAGAERRPRQAGRDRPSSLLQEDLHQPLIPTKTVGSVSHRRQDCTQIGQSRVCCFVVVRRRSGRALEPRCASGPRVLRGVATRTRSRDVDVE